MKSRFPNRWPRFFSPLFYECCIIESARETVFFTVPRALFIFIQNQSSICSHRLLR